jgi:Uma2 family endonuclease
MISTQKNIQQKLTFKQFLEQLPDEEGYYELVDGDIVRKQPTRQHEDIEIADRLTDIFRDEVKEQNYNTISLIICKG